MRLKVRSLRQAVKGDLPIEFVPQRLTSYGGLELVRRYVRKLAIVARLRAALAAIPSDYGSARLALLVMALFYVGARRLEHLQYLVGDPLVARFCGLARLPTARTVSNWLKQFTQTTLAPLVQLNHDLVVETLRAWRLPLLTLDVDGTVVCTGAQVQWAFWGFNPHHRKHLSYYPLLAHVAQTGHILRLKNRPGNVHDSKQAVAFVRELIDSVRAGLGRALPLEFRMDAGFFQREILRLLAARRCHYAIKVGYWSWLPLKQLAAERCEWTPLAPGVTGFDHRLTIPQWQLDVRVMIHRKHVRHPSRKNFQLDLFTPDDGHFEYYAVATNLTLGLPARDRAVNRSSVPARPRSRGEIGSQTRRTRRQRPRTPNTRVPTLRLSPRTCRGRRGGARCRSTDPPSGGGSRAPARFRGPSRRRSQARRARGSLQVVPTG
jgi:Transposase DDE domain group 1